MDVDPHPKPTQEPQPQSAVPFRYSIAVDETVCEAVYTAVATVEACSALDLDPLGESVDPDALNALFPVDGRNEQCHLTLQYCGYELHVTGDEITVLTVS